MRNVGIALFITGLALDVGGTVSYSVAVGCDNSSGCRPHVDGKLIGVGLWLGGAALTGTGIVLWWIGGRPARPSAEAKGRLRLAPFVAPTPGGAHGGFTLAF